MKPYLDAARKSPRLAVGVAGRQVRDEALVVVQQASLRLSGSGLAQKVMKCLKEGESQPTSWRLTRPLISWRLVP
jgi:hypothetical protein